MRLMDFTPLSRSSIGFDKLFDMIETATKVDALDSYPPYNIERTAEDAYRITLAVAGFEPEELSIVSQANQLLVAGRRARNDSGEYLYRGIPAMMFQRQFSMADYVNVTGATLHNGILAIALAREVPEASKPRRIAIGEGRAQIGTQQAA